MMATPSAAPVPCAGRCDEPEKLRVGYFEDDGRTPVTAETRAAVQTAAEALRSAGFDVDPFRPEGLEDSPPTLVEVFCVAGGMLLGPMFARSRIRTEPHAEAVHSLGRRGNPSHRGLASRYLDPARRASHATLRADAELSHPACVPVAAVPAFRHGERSWTIDGKTVKYLDAWSYCEWFNLLGMPAASVPVGVARKACPSACRSSRSHGRKSKF